MIVISDINQPWHEGILDIGPIELTDHYWGSSGRFPTTSRGPRAVGLTPPNWMASRS
jgi:hypothetical protein